MHENNFTKRHASERSVGIKKNKKWIYISLLKRLPIIKEVTSHATDLVEQKGIKYIFGTKSIVFYIKYIFSVEI